MLEKVNKYLTDLTFAKPDCCESGLLAELKDAIHNLHKELLSCKGTGD